MGITGIKRFLLNCLPLLLASPEVFAITAPQGTGPETPLADYSADWQPRWVATLSAGPVWADAGQTQTLNLAPGIQKTYTKTNSGQTLAAADLFLGMQRPLLRSLLIQFGLDVATTSDTSVSGNIWDDASPIFSNYTYQYQINHTHLNLKGKLLADRGYVVIPWLSASAGVGFNSSHNFSNSPLIYEAVPNSNFTSNTATAFNYTLGLGIQSYINKHWQVGLGYEFADWGRSYLGAASGQTTGNGLSLSHLYTNSLLLNFTYLS